MTLITAMKGQVSQYLHGVNKITKKFDEKKLRTKSFISSAVHISI